MNCGDVSNQNLLPVDTCYIMADGGAITKSFKKRIRTFSQRKRVWSQVKMKNALVKLELNSRHAAQGSFLFKKVF